MDESNGIPLYDMDLSISVSNMLPTLYRLKLHGHHYSNLCINHWYFCLGFSRLEMGYYSVNGEWDMQSHATRTSAFTDGFHNYTRIYVDFTFQRRWQFYGQNLVCEDWQSFHHAYSRAFIEKFFSCWNPRYQKKIISWCFWCQYDNFVCRTLTIFHLTCL